jgi:hypothetical protein
MIFKKGLVIRIGNLPKTVRALDGISSEQIQLSFCIGQIIDFYENCNKKLLILDRIGQRGPALWPYVWYPEELQKVNTKKG